MILKVFLIFSFILANSLVTNIKEVSGWKIKMKKINKASVELKEKIHKYTKAIGILRSNSGRVIAGVDHMISALLLSLNKRLAFLNGINNGVTVLNKNLRQFLKKHPARRDCADLCQSGIFVDGFHTIYPNGRKLKVYCDMNTAGGGWTVFQRRVDGSTDFYRTWNEYKKGFGNLRNFWLGNDNLYQLTHITGRPQMLRVELGDNKGNKPYAVYNKFVIGNENNKYRLTIGSYSGNAGDSFKYHKGMAFSTKDRDNDKWRGNCAVNLHGAWWYQSCSHSNLNGKYNSHGNGKGLVWYHYKKNSYSYPRTQMKIRPVDFKGCKK